MINPDLHCHSTVSDGTVSPAALVARAARRGVGTLALTDHDDTGGLAEAAAAALEHGIRFINGVEISVTWQAQTIHVVGLGIDPDHPVLQNGLAATRSGRIDRAQRMAAAFDGLGIHGTFEGAAALAGNPRMISRTHFARYLCDTGKVKNVKDAFRHWLGEGRPCNVDQEWAGLGDAVSWINASGGVAVIAHPARYRLERPQLRVLLSAFVDAGGAALEVVAGSQQQGQYAMFARYANEFGLAASCGSDFHSPLESRDLGGLPPLPAACEPVWQRLGLD
ncbi:MAG: PHP domain-containing protein [Betaproteobacteria bacterium]